MNKIKILILTFFFFIFSACDYEHVSIEQEVARDLEQQYEIALKGGDKIEIAINASTVAEAYKQAKDEENYLKWKEIAKKKSKEAGLE